MMHGPPEDEGKALSLELRADKDENTTNGFATADGRIAGRRAGLSRFS